jgi:hypothetical protein
MVEYFVTIAYHSVVLIRACVLHLPCAVRDRVGKALERCLERAQAIRLFGTDFSLIERMFPGRQRKALKKKLQREYRLNFARVDAALSGTGGTAAVDSYKGVADLLQQVRSM